MTLMNIKKRPIENDEALFLYLQEKRSSIQGSDDLLY